MNILVQKYELKIEVLKIGYSLESGTQDIIIIFNINDRSAKMSRITVFYPEFCHSLGCVQEGSRFFFFFYKRERPPSPRPKKEYIAHRGSNLSN